MTIILSSYDRPYQPSKMDKVIEMVRNRKKVMVGIEEAGQGRKRRQVRVRRGGRSG